MFGNSSNKCPLNSEGKVCSFFCKNYKECVFYSYKNSEKKNEFKNALNELVEIYKNNNSEIYNFQGFIFPEIDFNEYTFVKPLVFDDCVFLDSISFEDKIFAQKTTFNRAHFLQEARFNKSIFEEEVYFKNSRFESIINFDDCKFKKAAYFENSHFQNDVYFRRCVFGWDTFFDNSYFSNRSNFRNSVFHGYASFVNSRFLDRLKLLDTVFLDELRMNDSFISYLKNLTVSGVNFEGAVLKETHFGDNKILRGYSFKNSHLLSVSFANRKVIDCDFTGAVFKAVLIEGWEPDNQTISKTKYIYTDYVIEDEINKDGVMLTVYKPVEESRVPREGVFGQDSNVNFTLVDYLREPIKWSFALSLPPQIRTAVTNYIQFFTDFMLITEGVSVEIRTKKEGEKIRIEFVTENSEDKKVIQESFKGYLDNVSKEFSFLSIGFNNSDINEIERDLFLIKYENQLNSLKIELTYTQRLLKKEEEKNYQLLQFINNLSQQPRYLLNSNEISSQTYETPIYFLTADLKGYSNATKGNSRIYTIVQSYLFEQKERIEKESGCELVKLEGDCIKIFFRDGIKLVWIAKELISELEKLKYKEPINIDGFRIVLGFGNCYREQRGEVIDFSGDSIIETVRVDQPMKKYIELNKEQSNQIWCTKAFYKSINNKHENIYFEQLPKMSLDKGYSENAELYRVLIK